MSTSAFFGQLLEVAKLAHHIDENRAYVVGHSNCGFMSYRMAWGHADNVAAIDLINRSRFPGADTTVTRFQNRYVWKTAAQCFASTEFGDYEGLRIHLETRQPAYVVFGLRPDVAGRRHSRSRSAGAISRESPAHDHALHPS